MNEIEKLCDQHPEPASFASGYLTHLIDVINRLDRNEIAAFIETLIKAREGGRRIFFVGNGGSASTASHFANDIAIGTRSWKKPFKAISLCDNVSILTALGNDYGYEDIFVRQLETLFEPEDVVVAISASGNSPNVIKAVEYANSNGGVSVGLTGFDGGKLRQAARISILVPTDKGEYGPVEDVHMIIDHLAGAYLMGVCRKEYCGG